MITRRGLLEGLAALPVLGRAQAPAPPPGPICLIDAAAQVWREHPDPEPAEDASLTTSVLALVQPEWHRRCHAACTVVLDDARARQASARVCEGKLEADLVLTPTLTLDVFPGKDGPDPATTFGRMIEMAMADLVLAVRGAEAVGDVLYTARRRAYLLDHFLHVIVYRNVPGARR